LIEVARGVSTPLHDATITQRFRTDEVEAVWREEEEKKQNGGSEAAAVAASS
jgi:N6-L-threonylcarbamoyladenine synthase